MSKDFITQIKNTSIIEVSGDDALTYLQGQLSNDINFVTNELSQFSAYCTPKGRMLSLFKIFKRDGKIFLILASDILAPILKRLKMFVMMSKVDIKDVSDDYKHFGISISNSSILNEKIKTQLPLDNQASLTIDGKTFIKIPSKHPKYDCYITTDESEEFFKILSSGENSLENVSSDLWEESQINDGIPNISALTQDTFIPQMINLHALEGINFKKGCYTGQEVIARLHYLGKMKRLMFGAKFSIDKSNPSEIPLIGDKLYSPSSKSSQGAGKFVAISKTNEDSTSANYIGLAVIELSVVESNDAFIDEAHTTPMTIVTLPYADKLTIDE